MNKLTLDFNNGEDKRFNKYEQMFKRIFKKTISELKLTDHHYFVEVNIVDEESIQSINRDYRGKDKVTDVISFAFEDTLDPTKVATSAAPHILGTILICAQRAIEQALEYNHSEEREFKFLFVHGLLHLLGYDHQNEAEEQEMFNLQNLIIGKRGVNK